VGIRKARRLPGLLGRPPILDAVWQHYPRARLVHQRTAGRPPRREIWAGRKGFQDAGNAVRLGGKWFETPELEFTAFDAPQIDGTWPQRMAEVRKAVAKASCAVAVAFSCVNDALWTGNQNDLAEMLLRFSRLGSEGLMFRNPDANGYETGRSQNLLRVKF